MFRDILTVYKKEVKSILKDKTILLMCILLPFAFMVMEGFLMNAVNTSDKEDKTYNAYYIDAPEELVPGLKSIGFSDKTVDKDTCIEDIKNKDAEMLIVFPKDFSIDPTGEKLSNIEIWYNSSNMDSLQLRQSVSTLLDTLRPVVFTINADESVTYDLGDSDYIGKNLLAGMIPGMLIMTIFYGIMSLASNIIAGDKESNFLNTVLITPVSRSSVAIGKALAVLTAAGISAVSAFAGLAYLLKKVSGAFNTEITYAVSDYILIFLVIIGVAFALVGLILIISTLAKTSRSAQSLSVIPVMILFLGSFLSSNAGMEAIISKLGFKNCLIPMWNSTYVIKNIMMTGANTKELLVTCAINIVFGVLCLGIVSRLFNNEKIVNE